MTAPSAERTASRILPSSTQRLVAGFFGLGNLVSGTVAGLEPLTLTTPLGLFEAHSDNPPPQVGEHRTLLFRPGDARQSQTLLTTPSRALSLTRSSRVRTTG